MKAGPEFERDYVKAQVEGHKELLAIQEAYLKARRRRGRRPTWPSSPRA